MAYLPACNNAESDADAAGGQPVPESAVSADEADSSATEDNESAKSSPHPWPTVGQNYRRTSCSPYLGPEKPEVKWQVKLIRTASFQRYPMNSSPLLARDGSIFIQTDRHTLNAISRDGQLRWHTSTAGPWVFNQPFIAEDGSLVAAGDTIYRVDPDTGALNHLLDRDLTIPYLLDEQQEYSAVLPIKPDQLVAVTVGSRESSIRALQASSCAIISLDLRGNIFWQQETNTSTLVELAIGTSNQLYFLGLFGELVALEEAGTELWRYDSGLGAIADGPVVAHDGSILVYGFLSGDLHCIYPAGDVKWHQQFEPFRVRYCAVAPDGAIVISLGEGRKKNSATAPRRKLLGITADGTALWEVKLGDIGIADLTIDAAGVIYLPLQDGLYAYNPDGTQKWKLPMNDLAKQASIGTDGTIYVLGRDAFLYAIGEAD